MFIFVAYHEEACCTAWTGVVCFQSPLEFFPLVLSGSSDAFAVLHEDCATHTSVGEAREVGRSYKASNTKTLQGAKMTTQDVLMSATLHAYVPTE